MHGMFRDVAIALSLLSSLGFPAKCRAVEFAAPRTYVVGTNPSSAVVGDFNGDGKPDIALGNSGSDNVSVLLGNGDGTFRASANSPAGSSPAKLAVRDFNGDGKLDLIVVNSTIGSPGAANLLLGNGDGTFHSPVPITAGPSPVSVVVRDLNNDGKSDIIIGDQNGGNLYVILGIGSGTFQSAKTVSLGADSAVDVIVLADFNGDCR